MLDSGGVKVTRLWTYIKNLKCILPLDGPIMRNV